MLTKTTHNNQEHVQPSKSMHTHKTIITKESNARILYNDSNIKKIINLILTNMTLIQKHQSLISVHAPLHYTSTPTSEQIVHFIASIFQVPYCSSILKFFFTLILGLHASDCLSLTYRCFAFGHFWLSQLQTFLSPSEWHHYVR